MELYFVNEQNLYDDTSGIEDVIRMCVKKVFEVENIDSSVEVSVMFVDNDGIKDLNREFRNKDTATDVLSFPQYSNLNEIENDPEPNLGDIVISLERAKEQADEFGHSFEREIGFLTVHSMYHLLGYDHDTETHTNEMRKKEEFALNSMGLTRDDKI